MSYGQLLRLVTERNHVRLRAAGFVVVAALGFGSTASAFGSTVAADPVALGPAGSLEGLASPNSFTSPVQGYAGAVSAIPGHQVLVLRASRGRILQSLRSSTGSWTTTRIASSAQSYFQAFEIDPSGWAIAAWHPSGKRVGITTRIRSPDGSWGASQTMTQQNAEQGNLAFNYVAIDEHGNAAIALAPVIAGNATECRVLTKSRAGQWSQVTSLGYGINDDPFEDHLGPAGEVETDCHEKTLHTFALSSGRFLSTRIPGFTGTNLSFDLAANHAALVADPDGSAATAWISGLTLEVASRPAGGAWHTGSVSLPRAGDGIGSLSVARTGGVAVTVGVAGMMYTTTDQAVSRRSVTDPLVVTPMPPSLNDGSLLIAADGTLTDLWDQETCSTPTMCSDARGIASAQPVGPWAFTTLVPPVLDESYLGPAEVENRDGAQMAFAAYSNDGGTVSVARRAVEGSWTGPQQLPWKVDVDDGVLAAVAVSADTAVVLGTHAGLLSALDVPFQASPS